MLSLLLILSVPAAAVQAAVTKQVHQRARNEPRAASVMVRPLLADAVLWGVGMSSVLVVAFPFIKDSLHLPSHTSAILVAIDVMPVCIGVIPKTVRLGELRYRPVFTALPSRGTPI